LGPKSLEDAIPRGDEIIDDFPMNWSNHFEGHIQNHWEKNKSTMCIITNSVEMLRFVCSYSSKLFESTLINIFNLDMEASCKLLGKTGG
jgi:hypothetical protein